MSWLVKEQSLDKELLAEDLLLDPGAIAVIWRVIRLETTVIQIQTAAAEAVVLTVPLAEEAVLVPCLRTRFRADLAVVGKRFFQ